MKDYTIYDILKVIPLKQQTRTEIQRDYESYSEAKKSDVTLACWTAFHDLRQAMLDMVADYFTDEIAAGKRHATPTFMLDVEAAVEKEIDAIISGKVEERDELAKIRTQLESLITQ